MRQITKFEIPAFCAFDFVYKYPPPPRLPHNLHTTTVNCDQARRRNGQLRRAASSAARNEPTRNNPSQAPQETQVSPQEASGNGEHPRANTTTGAATQASQVSHESQATVLELKTVPTLRINLNAADMNSTSGLQGRSNV